MNFFNERYAIGPGGWSFGNSLWGAIKILRIYFFNNCDISILFKYYSFLTMTILIAVSTYILMIEKIFWKKVCLILILMSILPSVSGDYKLIHLFIPLFLFIDSEEKDKYDMIYVILFSLLLISKAYYHFPFELEVTEGVIIDPLLMVLIMFFIIYDGVKTKLLIPKQTEN